MPELKQKEDTIVEMPKELTQQPANEEKSKIPSPLAPLTIATSLILMAAKGSTAVSMGLSLALLATGITISNISPSKEVAKHLEQAEKQKLNKKR